MKIVKLTLNTVAISLAISLFVFVALMLSGALYDYESTEFGNWAMWTGSIFGGLAALGAFANLMMINKQHQQNIDHQNRVWVKQELMLDFERSQVHRRLFFELLDEIELKYKAEVTFTNKPLLYRRLFPTNTSANEYSKYSYNLSNLSEDNRSNHRLTNVQNALNELYSTLNGIAQGEDVELYKISNASSVIRNELRLDFSKASETGDLTNDGYDTLNKTPLDIFVINLINPRKYCKIVNDINHMLCDFCGYIQSENKITARFSSNSTVKFQLFNHFKNSTEESIYLGHLNIFKHLSSLFMYRDLIQLNKDIPLWKNDNFEDKDECRAILISIRDTVKPQINLSNMQPLKEIYNDIVFDLAVTDAKTK